MRFRMETEIGRAMGLRGIRKGKSKTKLNVVKFYFFEVFALTFLLIEFVFKSAFAISVSFQAETFG